MEDITESKSTTDSKDDVIQDTVQIEGKLVLYYHHITVLYHSSL